MPVPIAMGIPIMMHSLTPVCGQVCMCGRGLGDRQASYDYGKAGRCA